MFSFIAATIVGTILTASLILVLGYRSRDTLTLSFDYLPVLIGLLFAATLRAIKFYQELRRLRALKQFIWCWSDSLELQQQVIDDLRRSASSVKAHSERLILLQRGGLSAVESPLINAKDEKALSEAFDNEKKRLTCAFRESQSMFYRDYDQIQLFTELVRVKLRDRSWKAYANEPVKTGTDK